MGESQRESHCWRELIKSPLELPRGMWETSWSTGRTFTKHCTSPQTHHPHHEAWWWQHHAVGMLLSRSWRLLKVEGSYWLSLTLEDNLTLAARELWLGRRFIFQKDNNQTEKVTRKRFKDNKVDVLDLPSQSPHLNKSILTLTLKHFICNCFCFVYFLYIDRDSIDESDSGKHPIIKHFLGSVDQGFHDVRQELLPKSIRNKQEWIYVLLRFWRYLLKIFQHLNLYICSDRVSFNLYLFPTCWSFKASDCQITITCH